MKIIVEIFHAELRYFNVNNKFHVLTNQLCSKYIVGPLICGAPRKLCYFIMTDMYVEHIIKQLFNSRIY